MAEQLRPPLPEVNPLHQETLVRKMVTQRDEYLAVEMRRLHRLTEVLSAYLLYKPDYQKDLADAAVAWALASLADSPRCSEIESHFHLFVDALYFSTDDAMRLFSERDRCIYFSDAFKERERQLPAFREIMGACVRSLSTLDAKHPRRVMADILAAVGPGPIEQANAPDLPELILHCTMFCKANNCYRLGAPAIQGVPAIVEVERLQCLLAKTVMKITGVGTGN